MRKLCQQCHMLFWMPFMGTAAQEVSVPSYCSSPDEAPNGSAVNIPWAVAWLGQLSSSGRGWSAVGHVLCGSVASSCV